MKLDISLTRQERAWAHKVERKLGENYVTIVKALLRDDEYMLTLWKHQLNDHTFDPARR